MIFLSQRFQRSFHCLETTFCIFADPREESIDQHAVESSSWRKIVVPSDVYDWLF